MVIADLKHITSIFMPKIKKRFKVIKVTILHREKSPRRAHALGATLLIHFFFEVLNRHNIGSKASIIGEENPILILNLPY